MRIVPGFSDYSLSIARKSFFFICLGILLEYKGLDFQDRMKVGIFVDFSEHHELC